jgi:hypothetical protein
MGDMTDIFNRLNLPPDATVEQIADTVLDGIDEDECDSRNGWWETSTGAAFGAQKKVDIIEAMEYVERRGKLAGLRECEAMARYRADHMYRPASDAVNQFADHIAACIAREGEERE